MDPFQLDWIQRLFEQRTEPATALFQLATGLGEVEGYVLAVAAVHAAWDERLAFRLAVLVLAAMCLNHALKTWIANPRPFVAEGTWGEKWAVSADRARELATEYSTPSGHAMAGSAFYAYLAARARSRALWVAACAAIVATGLSRPYLGVHYVEDVVTGWVLGLALAGLSVRYGEAVARALRAVPLPALWSGVVAASALGWLATRAVYVGRGAEPPLAWLTYTGFLAGSVLGYRLEGRWIRFDPRSGGAPRKLVRTVLAVALVLGLVGGLDAAFGALAADTSLAGQALRFLRYALAGLVGFLLAPALSVRLGLARARAAGGS